MIWNVQFDVILCALFGGKIQTWSKSLQGVWLLKNTYLYLFKTSCITRKCILVTNRLCTDFRKSILKSRLACIYLFSHGHSYGRPIFVEHILHSRQQRLAAFYLQKLDKKCLYCFGEWTKTRFFSSSDIANVWPIAFQY